MDEFVSRCGYCGDVIDYCQGHGEDERATFGFDYDSDEYEARREFFERDDRSETHRITVVFDMEEMTGSPEESAEVLTEVYLPNELTIVSVHAEKREVTA